MLGFAVIAFLKVRRKDKPRRSRVLTHEEALVSGLIDFHKAQCFFSGTVQIASITYGIFKTNILNNFLLLPLATNGLIPIVLAYIMVIRYGRSSTYLAALTVVTWLLSSFVFWVLYNQLIGITFSEEGVKNPQLYYQFMLQSSANPSCGGYSGLTLCPDRLVWTPQGILPEADRIKEAPPYIWGWSTMSLFATLVIHYRPRLKRKETQDETTRQRHPYDGQRKNRLLSGLRQKAVIDGLFWIFIAIPIAILGLQISLLFGELSMMDHENWSFGQIMAVTIWAPPIVEYLYLLARKSITQKTC